MTRSIPLVAALAALLAAGALPEARAQQAFTFAASGDPAFDAWRDGFAQRAVAAGRNPAVVQQLLGPLRPDPRIVTQDQNQAEFVRPVWDYITRAVTPQRIAEGVARRQANAQLFTDIERRFGVDADIIAGIWAVETNYGAFPLPHDAPQALATLAADGRRRGQFEGYLLALIEMVEKGYVGPNEMKSSWAGALGQPQFMPDIYLTTAVDWDGDGKRDIWNNTGDTLASIANYLAARGWRRNEPVYDEVYLPQDFDYALADGTARPVSQWVTLGARSTSGFPYMAPVMAMNAQLFLPAGAQGPALLLFPNFGVIRSYNPSDRYALTVSLLARGYEGGAGLVKPWPVEIGSLSRDQLLELQTALNKLGFNAGTPDGMFGAATRRAVRQFQQSVSLPADGYPTPALLDRVKGRTGAIDKAAAQNSSPSLRTEAGIRSLQQALIRLGRLKGRADGDVGPATRRAIEAFERGLDLEPTGRATQFILDEARKAASQVPAPRTTKKRRR
ncbi:MAG: lytic murein transglycosylase [Hyphomonadaceae bacterium]|nr:lytic murein transglycosylase [Hyphomonadaceae bacterium]